MKRKSSIRIATTSTHTPPAIVVVDYALVGFSTAYGLALTARAVTDARVAIAVVFAGGVAIVIILHHWYPTPCRVAMLVMLLSVGVAIL